MQSKTIQEAEELIQDLYVLLDLKDEEIKDLREDLRRAKGQLSLIRQDRRVELA